MNNIKKSNKEKEALILRLKNVLNGDENILFAYIFGSFVSRDFFHDIDVALYLDNSNKSSLELELKMEVELSRICKIPIDVRILNDAPLPFRYNVLKTGRLILDRDPLRRSDFESLTYRMYFDFKRFRIEYLREAKNVPF